MSELFNEKEINPTIKVVVSMKQSEKNAFSEFSKKSNIPFSAVVRMAVKNFIKNEGSRYIND